MRNGRNVLGTGAIAAVIAMGSLAVPAGAWAIVDAGAISGQVINHHTHAPSVGAAVCATPTFAGITAACVPTNGSGDYKIEGLESNGLLGEEYEVRASHSGLESSSRSAEVEDGVTTGGVDFELDELGAISGVVTAGGVPVKNAEVCAIEYECADTGPNGTYVLEHLGEGRYVVSFAGPQIPCGVSYCPGPYILQYWDAASLPAAQEIEVEEGMTVSSIDGALQIGGAIAGKVTSAASGKPIAGTRVCAYSRSLEVEVCASTNAAGEYTVPRLPTGSYELAFYGTVCVESGGHSTCTQPWIGQYYQALVSVTQPATTSGINIALVEYGHEKPMSTAAPAVTGTASVGSTLTCSQGSWGNLPTSFAYQWLRNGVAIAGQSTPTYTVAIADEATSLSCRVTATNIAGSTAAASTALAIAKPTPGVAAVTGVSVKGSAASVTLKCTGQNACVGKLELLVRVNVRGHGKHRKTTVHNVVIGTAALLIVANTSKTIEVHLDSAGQKLLHAAGKKGLKIEFTGGVTTATKTVK